MQQALDFLEESEILNQLLERIRPEDYNAATLFKSWSVNDVLVHLHFWNHAADLSLNATEAFQDLYSRLRENLANGTLREFENGEIAERGPVLRQQWWEHTMEMSRRWQEVDPKTRVKWAGPEMSVRSSMSARQMEVWAHGQEIFDLFGVERTESNRIRNIVVLGVNAFGWSFKVHGLEVPDTMPVLTLSSPGHEIWTFGDNPLEGSITGSAVEFCQVVTQTRNILDTSLKLEGEIARIWMENAQCFAGPPETPPAPGTRVKSSQE